MHRLGAHLLFHYCCSPSFDGEPDNINRFVVFTFFLLLATYIPYGIADMNSGQPSQIVLAASAVTPHIFRLARKMKSRKDILNRNHNVLCIHACLS